MFMVFRGLVMTEVEVQILSCGHFFFEKMTAFCHETT